MDYPVNTLKLIRKLKKKKYLQMCGPAVGLFETIQPKEQAFSYLIFSQYIITRSHHMIYVFP